MTNNELAALHEAEALALLTRTDVPFGSPGEVRNVKLAGARIEAAGFLRGLE